MASAAIVGHQRHRSQVPMDTTNIPEPKPFPDDIAPEKAAEKIEKRKMTRTNVMNELVATEETYVHQLQELMQEYVEPLSSNRLVTPDQHKGLFPDLLTILNLNANFLDALRGKQREWDNERSLLGDEFLKFAPYFKMYQNYVNNHENATEIQQTLLSSSAFTDFCSRAQTKTGLDLSSLLILPIQRVPRYELCLRELLRNTSEEHPDRGNLVEAFIHVRHVNGTINQRMKEHDARKAVRGIERRLGGISLIAPSRVFLLEGELMKVCRKNDRRYVFILFSDMLMYCARNGEQQLTLHNQLPINDAFNAVDVEASTKYADRCFIIHSSVKSFLVYADNYDDKCRWLTALHDVREAERIASSENVRPAPVWHPDDFSDHCMICTHKFTLLKRRHHCRYCGKLVCNDCSQNQLPNLNPNERQQMVRACDICNEKFRHVAVDDIHVLSEDDDSDGFEQPE